MNLDKDKMMRALETAPRFSSVGRVYYYKRVPYVARGKLAPVRFKHPATCGQCGRTWDDAASTELTPTPGARCPFEYIHRGQP